MFFSTLPVKKTLTIASVISSSVLLTGCGSLTGLNANDDFSCPMQPGVQCRSLSDTYQDSILRRTPDQLAKDREIEASSTNANNSNTPLAPAVTTTDGEAVPTDTIVNNVTVTHATDKTPNQLAQQPFAKTTPLGVTKAKQKAHPVLRPISHIPARVPEVIVTIWMAPWTDDEGDFHEGEKIHARAFDARWASARRRADLADNRRAVVQLPYTAIERRPLGDESQTSTNNAPQAYGQGARAFQTAKRKALEGTDFIEKRFQETQSFREDDSTDDLSDDTTEPDDTTVPDDRLGVVAATEHGRVVSQATNGGSR